MDNSMTKRKLNAGNFVVNNGIVLRTINILRHKYTKLSSVQYAVEYDGVNESEFLDSINFLEAAGYIHLRNVSSHADALLADSDYRELESKITEKGMRLLGYEIIDKMIEV